MFKKQRKRTKKSLMNINITFLVFYGLSILLITILFNKSIESQILVTELLKILISGYLGYLIRTVEDKSS